MPRRRANQALGTHNFLSEGKSGSLSAMRKTIYVETSIISYWEICTPVELLSEDFSDV
jgi:hypothetical protein